VSNLPFWSFLVNHLGTPACLFNGKDCSVQ
jgi:hypothetical protein